MNRSFRKSFTTFEFESLIKSINDFRKKNDTCLIEDSTIHKIKAKLFEDLRSKAFFLLKSDIRKIEDIDILLEDIHDNDLINALKKFLIINDDLEIDEELLELIKGPEEIAFFIGTGISNLLGIPLWGGLADKAIEYLKEECYINVSEAKKLMNEKNNPKQIISIFHELVKSAERQKFYERILKGTKGKDNPYELIKKLEYLIAKPILKITTNIDKEWENVLNKKGEAIVRDGDLNLDNHRINIFYENFKVDTVINSNTIYKIHGSLDNVNTSIMTVKDYVEKYRDEKGLKGFLDNVFQKYNVIFLGVGLQEFEILEHCLKKSGKSHFTLIPKNFREDNLFRLKLRYFNMLTIKAIPYYLDFQGYERFNIVMKSWIDEMNNIHSSDFYEKTKLIDEV